MADLNEPNLYELAGDDVRVIYSTSSFDGSPRLSFQEAERKFDFSGEEIRTNATELGTEVTVTLEIVADEKSVTLTLLVPGVNLGKETEVSISTAAIETTNHTTFGGPRLITGPLQTYRVFELHGSAKRVDF